MNKNTFAKLALIVVGAYAVAAAAAPAPAANPATTTFQVTFKVDKSCSVSATDLNLGEQEVTGNVITAAATSAVTVTCSKQTGYTIALVPGNNSSVGTGSLASVTPLTNTDTVAYQLYKTAATAGNEWGSSVGTNTVAGMGDGAAHAVTVYGKVTGSVNITPDSYKDTVTVNVAY